MITLAIEERNGEEVVVVNSKKIEKTLRLHKYMYVLNEASCVLIWANKLSLHKATSIIR
jgi:hypothetical protein